jgi:hypothetical protein
MGTAYNANIVTDGLVLCLDAANPRSYSGSGDRWLDIVGNKQLIMYNMNSGDWDSKGYFNFDGSNSEYFTNSFGADVSNGYSLSSLFKQTTLGAAVIQLYGQDQVPVRFSVQNTYLIFFQTYTATGLYTVNNSIDLNKWNHVVCTFSGTSTQGGTGNLKVYLNGNLIGSNTTSGSPFLSTAIRIGRLNNAYYSGSIASVMIHNKELSAQEVRQNFNATRGRYGY